MEVGVQVPRRAGPALSKKEDTPCPYKFQRLTKTESKRYHENPGTRSSGTSTCAVRLQQLWIRDVPRPWGPLFHKDATKYSITTWNVPLVGLQLRSRQGPVYAPTETLSWGSPVACFKRMLPSPCNETGFCVLWKRGPHGLRVTAEVGIFQTHQG